ncbi:hypothetical protein K466DRAFT_605772 [Polyporus arcularius HHB13444]|uniref:CxC2-like cysteine cluster KDZ transposase-associated domain-containing protein n=1 Tax=Polyporus arcularius HHB13444 TaxID=1314778 RepID=A0A5C3NV80_9APHY|nr:hypothetical protein K466DRAFT_605772 [Polyporus arcularius HHB13444]
MSSSLKRTSSNPSTSRPRKKAKFKTIEVDPPDAATRLTRQVDRMVVTSTSKGNFSVKTSRKKVYLTPEDLFSDAATEELTNVVDDIVRDFTVEQAENLEEVTAKQKKRETRADLRASTKVVEWLPMRQQTLDELLRYEGCDEDVHSPLLCSGCGLKDAVVRCMECEGRELRCGECAVDDHSRLPLHRLQEWDGKTFKRTSLRTHGLVVQLGHNGQPCANPSSKTRRIVVVDITGVHEVEVSFCECISAGSRTLVSEWVQLMRRGWFPATNNRPATAFTFRTLDTFQETNFQGKLSLYDYWRSLERLTDNTGTGRTLNRYKQFCHVIRLWRHLVMLKRAGRAHNPAGASSTAPGELAVECPACPHPGKNLPEDWEKSPPDMMWLFTLFLMLDANFRAKCKARGLESAELGSGWSYFVEELAYQEHLKKYSAQTEENQCSAEHNAIINANLRRDGYIASGVGAVLCARHALVRRNGTADTQNGEKYANMDYIFFATLLGVVIFIILISYDIACQWERNLLKRMAMFPPHMRIDTSRTTLRYTIPKKHYRVHGPNHSRYSLNFVRHVGRTYGEGIESHWSHMNPVALSAREMALGARHELLNDHWGAYNWQKIIGFASSFLSALHEAKTMHAKQRAAFKAFSAAYDEGVRAQWDRMIDDWHKDPRKPDPYEEVTTKLSQNAVRRQLATEEAAEKDAGELPAHETSPSVFLQVGLELEEQQRVLGLMKVSRNSDKSAAEFQEKRNLVKRRIQIWQSIQDVHMPSVPALRAASASSSSPTIPVPSDSSTNSNSTHTDATPAAANTLIEDIKLWLPSALPPSLSSLQSLSSLRDKERRLRLAQLSDCLDDIRRLRRVLTGITEFKRLNVSGTGQRANTRIRSLYARFEAKIRRSVLRYRAARVAMEALDPQGEWAVQFKILHDGDVKGPGREDDAASEGRHETSWIWLTPSSVTSVSSAADPTKPMSPSEFSESMRVEYARFKARVDRWDEEERLLQEEMRRILDYFEHKASWWREQAGRRTDVSPALRRALSIYAERQAATFKGLRMYCASLWVPYLRTYGTVPEWAAPFAEVPAKKRASRIMRQRLYMVDVSSDSSSSSSEESDGEGSAGSEGETDH